MMSSKELISFQVTPLLTSCAIKILKKCSLFTVRTESAHRWTVSTEPVQRRSRGIKTCMPAEATSISFKKVLVVWSNSVRCWAKYVGEKCIEIDNVEILEAVVLFSGDHFWNEES